tara:strand:+ start:2209 stop:2733 length:525 start_codon:yes stop_codon:yes gene_type:complete
MKVKKHEPTEGEEIIRDYLFNENIKFKEQEEIPNLKNDTYSKRVADFYLPQYKIYIEFLGQWNSEKGKERYNEKKKIYRENNIPCVYIYPENLGILNFILKRRIKKVLQDPKLKWQLFKFNWTLFAEDVGIGLIVFIALIYFIDILWTRILFGIGLINVVYQSLNKTYFRKIRK